MEIHSNLSFLGFEAHFRQAQWSECLLVGPNEQWLGIGLDEETAWQEALRQAVPSPAVRAMLLGAALEVPAAATAAPLPTVTEPAVVQPAVVPPPPRSAPVAAEEIAQGLQDLERELAAADGELGLLAPDQMRLVLCGFIAQARALQTASREDLQVSKTVTGMANRLTRWSKIYWPGSVKAMQLHMNPAGCAMDMPPGVGREQPHSWSALASAVAQFTEEWLLRPDFDEDGWADAGALHPPPSNPSDRLTEVLARMESLSGPLEEASQAEAHALPSGKALRELRDLAAMLRWLRGAEIDPHAWGQAMGRLRWLAERTRDEQLTTLLDSRYRPAGGSWGQQLGMDPQQKNRQRERREAFQSRPRQGADVAQVLAWLMDAKNALDGPEMQLALAREGLIALVEQLTIDVNTVPDSSHRRRLKRFQKSVLERKEPSERAKLAIDKLTQDTAEEIDAGAAEAVATQEADPHANLQAQVRLLTSGRRLAVLSNRNDKDLEQRLILDLQPASLDWVESKPATVEALARRVAGGAYDIVVVVTGFLSHAAEATVRRAAGPGVSLVRANRCRRVACMSAILRDVPLPRDEQTQSPPEAGGASG